MVAKSVIDSRLWVRLDLDATLKANSFFHVNHTHRAHLANQLLLYDRVIIPTKDFGIIPILLSWMGHSTLVDALESGALGFVRLETILGYAGNGSGLSEYRFEETEKSRFNWWQAAEFGSFDEAPDIQLLHQCPFLSKPQRENICQLVLKNSSKFKLEKEIFIKRVRHETYADVTSIPEYVDYLIANEPPGTTKIYPRLLSGVDKDQIRVLNLEKIDNSIDLLLRTAEINLEILMGHYYGESDLSTSFGADTLLKQKLVRCGAVPNLIEKFQTLLQLDNIPDINPAIMTGEISIPEIWKLRQKKVSRQFRKWLQDAQADDSRELEKAYVASLRKTSKYTSLPAKLIRFTLTTAVAAFEPLTGTLASASDSFFVEKWLKGYSPSLFMDQIRALPKGQQNGSA
jgi:hypothetical protein